jgi:hypothetical protein
LIFSSTIRNKKLEKPSAHAQKVPVYYYKPSKKSSSCDTIPLNVIKLGAVCNEKYKIKLRTGY